MRLLLFYFMAPIVDLLKSKCLAFQVIDSVWPHYFIRGQKEGFVQNANIHAYKHFTHIFIKLLDALSGSS